AVDDCGLGRLPRPLQQHVRGDRDRAGGRIVVDARRLLRRPWHRHPRPAHRRRGVAGGQPFEAGRIPAGEVRQQLVGAHLDGRCARRDGVGATDRPRGESRTVDPLALLAPYLWLTAPVLAMTAAAAVLFDTVSGLRTGLGNIVWFFGWMVAAVAGGRSEEHTSELQSREN